MAVKKVYLTSEGARVSAYCQNNSVGVNFTRIGLGSGENYNPSEATKVTEEKLTIPITSCKRIETNHYKIRAEFLNDILENDLVYRELCLYCDDPENKGNQIMYCYGNAKTDEYDYTEVIPAFSTSGNASSRIIEIDTYVQGDNATYTIDDSAKVDIVTFEQLRNDLEQEKTDRENADSLLQKNIDKKVDKVSGKGLSTNDFTTEEKEKLATLENYDDTPLKNAFNKNLDWENKIEFQNWESFVPTKDALPYKRGKSFIAPANGVIFWGKPYTTSFNRQIYFGIPPRDESQMGGIFELHPKGGNTVPLGGGIYWTYLEKVICDDYTLRLTLQDERDFQKIIPCNKGDCLYTYTTDIPIGMPCGFENFFGTWYFVPYKEV